MGSEICQDFCHYCRMRWYYGSNYRLEVLRQVIKDILDNIEYITNETDIDLSIFRDRGKVITLLINILMKEYNKLEIDPE